VLLAAVATLLAGAGAALVEPPLLQAVSAMATGRARATLVTASRARGRLFIIPAPFLGDAAEVLIELVKIAFSGPVPPLTPRWIE
jgi:hypothetical protein